MILRFNTPTFILSILVLTFSCKSQHPDMLDSNIENSQRTTCPDEGKCNFSLSSNQSIQFKKDEFGIGYAEFIKKDALLLKFEYQRDDIPNTVDGQYIERIYLELPNHPKTLNLKYEELKNINLLFERVCYCKGETGLYKIDQGTLSLKPLGNNSYHLKLKFKSSVPQVITEIDEIFSLNEQ